MAWFFRAIEHPGGWTCRHGLRDFDTHEALSDATEHLIALSAGLGPIHIFAHYLDGRVQRLTPESPG